MAKISLNGMEFKAFHGLYDEEKEMGNHFVVDLRIEADISAAAATDDIEDAVDYVEVYETVSKVMMGERRNLLEGLTDQIIRDVLVSLPQVKEVWVRVSKLNPPLSGTCASSSVEATGKRRPAESS